jgi:hypothetical protein
MSGRVLYPMLNQIKGSRQLDRTKKIIIASCWAGAHPYSAFFGSTERVNVFLFNDLSGGYGQLTKQIDERASATARPAPPRVSPSDSASS